MGLPPFDFYKEALIKELESWGFTYHEYTYVEKPNIFKRIINWFTK